MNKAPRLATLKEDYWQLRAAEKSHDKNPDTFEIPSIEERNNIHKGQAAKLIFDIETEDEGGNIHLNGERMWVIVKEKIDQFYLGLLDNDPSCIDPGTGNPKKGDELYFLPEHIIDIANPPRTYIEETYGIKI